MDNKLYHITTQENFNKILESGAILPLLGNNSDFNHEKKSAIYLCEYNDIWLWNYILGGDIILQINDIDKDELEYHKYFNIDDLAYKEYVSYDKIEINKVQQITLSYNKEEQDKNIDKFVRMSIIQLNRNIERIMRYSKDYSNIILQNKIKHNLITFLKTYPRLDSEWITKNEEKIFSLLRRISYSGYNTFLDIIGNTELKVYKMLPIISLDTPDKEIGKLISNLYDWINEKFNNYILSTEIGQCDYYTRR